LKHRRRSAQRALRSHRRVKRCLALRESKSFRRSGHDQPAAERLKLVSSAGERVDMPMRDQHINRPFAREAEAPLDVGVLIVEDWLLLKLAHGAKRTAMAPVRCDNLELVGRRLHCLQGLNQMNRLRQASVEPDGRLFHVKILSKANKPDEAFAV